MTKAEENEEDFAEAYNTWDLERLYADLAMAGRQSLSKSAKECLRGILCGYKPIEIADTLGHRGKDRSNGVRKTLSQEVYPAIEALVSPDQKIDWKKAHPLRLLEKYRKGSSTPLTFEIPWKQVCQEVLERRHKKWLTSHPLGAARRVQDVYVPLELVERQSKPRLEQDFNPESFSVREQEEKTTSISHQDFFDSVLKGQSPKSQGKRIAIIGEPGAGKTTLLQEISTEVDVIPIWIDLASLKKGDTLDDYLLHNWLKSSLSLIREYAPEVVTNLLEPSTELIEAFTQLFEQNQVWLLLDGADEMSAELGLPLNWVAKQVRQPDWFAKAKVILTCRLNLWNTDGARLFEFDTYRNLDFEPKQVIEFIDKWFAQKPDSREKLKNDLEKSSDRLKSLIRNPLRLTLLCMTWKDVGDRLPKTKAGLYQRFVHSHYEHLWKTKPEYFAQFSDEKKQDKLSYEKEQDKLNRWLGELSKTALDGKDSQFQGRRFRFRKSTLTYFAKQSEQGSDFLEWAEKLGWLHQIGLPSSDESDADEAIYTFFHPTFQEYFAALAIDDSAFFLNHIPNEPTSKKASYRIFESQWKEVILLWMGRKVDNNFRMKKEGFIENLVNFKDGCENFYSYRAYFIAAEVIAEFVDCKESIPEFQKTVNKIHKQVNEWRNGKFENPELGKRYYYPVALCAIDVLSEERRSNARKKLENLKTSYQERRQQAAEELLHKLETGNKDLSDREKFVLCRVAKCQVENWSDLLGDSEKIVKIANQLKVDSPILWKAIERLGEIGKNNPKAIEFLLSCILPDQNDIFWQNVRLAEAFNRDIDDVKAIDSLLTSIKSPKGKGSYIFWKAIYHLVQICPESEIDNKLKEYLPNIPVKKIAKLVKKIYLAKEEDNTNAQGRAEKKGIEEFLQELVGTLGTNHVDWFSRIIQSLKNYLQPYSNSQDHRSDSVDYEQYYEQYQKLYELDLLDYLFHEESDLERFRDCYQTLWYCAQVLSYSEFYSAWHQGS